MKKVLSLSFALMMLTGCTATYEKSLTENISHDDIAPIEIVAENDQAEEITQFSLDIFNSLDQDKNVLISPLSIISALAMTANGADNNTLEQMEATFGADISMLNNYLYTYNLNLPTAEKYQVSLANSIWIKDAETLTVRKNFLKTNANYYNSQVFKTVFDNSLPKKVNTWVEENTGGMIDKVLEENTVPTGVMYLINALSFDAEWQKIYEEADIKPQLFTNYNGTTTKTDMMHSSEYTYLEMEKAVGFKKYYTDKAYSFVAILPDEDVDIHDFVASLDGEILIDAMKNTTNETVRASIPKFSIEYDKKLKEVLIYLGMSDAFDSNLADFSRMGTSQNGELFIEQVIHKTKIDVDEKGTKAGAITVVAMTEGAMEEPQEIKYYLAPASMWNDFGGSLPGFLTAFMGGRKLNQHQAEELKKLIDDYKEV